MNWPRPRKRDRGPRAPERTRRVHVARSASAAACSTPGLCTTSPARLKRPQRLLSARHEVARDVGTRRHVDARARHRRPRAAAAKSRAAASMRWAGTPGPGLDVRRRELRDRRPERVEPRDVRRDEVAVVELLVEDHRTMPRGASGPRPASPADARRRCARAPCDAGRSRRASRRGASRPEVRERVRVRRPPSRENGRHAGLLPAKRRTSASTKRWTPASQVPWRAHAVEIDGWSIVFGVKYHGCRSRASTR
jgi:hypothetical protein